MLPNGSIVSCSFALKDLLESIPPELNVKRYLRVANQGADVDKPYARAVTPYAVRVDTVETLWSFD